MDSETVHRRKRSTSIKETFTRLSQRLRFLLSEAEEETPPGNSYVPGPNDIPVYASGRLGRVSFVRQTARESEEPLFYVQVDPQDVARVRRHRWVVQRRRGQISTVINSRINSRTRSLGQFILDSEERVNQRNHSTEEERRNYRRANLYRTVDRLVPSPSPEETELPASRADPNAIPIYPQRIPTTQLRRLNPESQAFYQPARVLYTVEVDPEDVARVQEYTWRESSDGYPYTSIRVGGSIRSISLGQFILQSETSVFQRRRDGVHARDFHRNNLGPLLTRIPVYPEGSRRLRRQGQQQPLYSVEVDPEDFERVQRHTWLARNIAPDSAPYTSINRRHVRLGTFILQTENVSQRQATDSYRRANLYVRRSETKRVLTQRVAQMQQQTQALPSSSSTGYVDVPSTNGWTIRVDPDMEDVTRRYRWSVLARRKTVPTATRFLSRRRGGRDIFLERVILGLQDPDTGISLGKDILVLDPPPDIVNRFLDLRRTSIKRVGSASRLLLASTEKKQGSSSKYYGVYFDKRAGKWNVSISIPKQGTIPGMRYHVGRYNDEDAAALDRDRAVIALDLDRTRGLRLNFPRSHYETEAEYPQFRSLVEPRN